MGAQKNGFGIDPSATDIYIIYAVNFQIMTARPSITNH